MPRSDPVAATSGMVATSHPQAAQIGVDILRAGGNAIDAAVATNAAMGFMEPMGCGIGGDLFALVWDAKQRKLFGLNASGRSPYAASIALFRDHVLDYIPIHGPLSWSVPGCVDGWDQLLNKFGSMPLSKILEPAIDAAERGIATPPIIANTWSNAETFLRETPEAAATFLIDGNSPRAGEIFRNPRLAATYRDIAREGRDASIAAASPTRSSPTAKASAASSPARFRRSCLDLGRSRSTNYRGHDVWQIPPPVRHRRPADPQPARKFRYRFDGLRLRRLVASLHRGQKTGLRRPRTFYADPDSRCSPRRIDLKILRRRPPQAHRPVRAAANVPPGEPARGDTIYLSVVDKDRNCCSLIQSNFDSFGSRHIAGSLGFALQNRGNSFTLDRNCRNALAPHKRPFHTIIPASSRKTASRISASASWAATCSRKARCKCSSTPSISR
jgi:gamma-glutamyltranspeptidase/glutathione hydrolase